MKLNVKKIASLLRLHVPEGRLTLLERDMAAILDMVSRLPPAEEAQGDPMTVSAMAWREDVVQPSTPREALLKNAPVTAGEYIKVPCVLE